MSDAKHVVNSWGQIHKHIRGPHAYIYTHKKHTAATSTAPHPPATSTPPHPPARNPQDQPLLPRNPQMSPPTSSSAVFRKNCPYSKADNARLSRVAPPPPTGPRSGFCHIVAAGWGIFSRHIFHSRPSPTESTHTAGPPPPPTSAPSLFASSSRRRLAAGVSWVGGCARSTRLRGVMSSAMY
jgi:hypothetical protein